MVVKLRAWPGITLASGVTKLNVNQTLWILIMSWCLELEITVFSTMMNVSVIMTETLPPMSSVSSRSMSLGKVQMHQEFILILLHQDFHVGLVGKWVILRAI